MVIIRIKGDFNFVFLIIKSLSLKGDYIFFLVQAVKTDLLFVLLCFYSVQVADLESAGQLFSLDTTTRQKWHIMGTTTTIPSKDF